MPSGNKPLPELSKCRPRSMTPYGFIRPQRVNGIMLKCGDHHDDNFIITGYTYDLRSWPQGQPMTVNCKFYPHWHHLGIASDNKIVTMMTFIFKHHPKIFVIPFDLKSHKSLYQIWETTQCISCHVLSPHRSVGSNYFTVTECHSPLCHPYIMPMLREHYCTSSKWCWSI